MRSRVGLAAAAVGAALILSKVDAAGYLVTNCSEDCSVIVNTTGDIDATCEPVEGSELLFECECYRPCVLASGPCGLRIMVVSDVCVTLLFRLLLINVFCLGAVS